VVGLARGQLDAQSAAGDNIDLNAMGLLGFDGALVAANLAAKDLLRDHPWWLPLAPRLALKRRLLAGALGAVLLTAAVAGIVWGLVD
jgi:hypothetical protein